MKKTNNNSQIIKILGIKPILYNPLLAEISGSVTAGVFLSQLLYWSNKGKYDWFYKTIDEIYQETRLTRNEQDSAIRIWKSIKILKTQVLGYPPKRHFLIDMPLLAELINEYWGGNLKWGKIR